MPNRRKIKKLPRPKNNKFFYNPYLIVNGLIAGIILLMLIYSGIFSASGIPYPIHSQTIAPTISTGLSRAFSEIVRLNFDSARQFNAYSLPIFLFFFIQFFIRIIIIQLFLSTRINQKVILFTDVLVSVLLFLWSFGNFIVDQF